MSERRDIFENPFSVGTHDRMKHHWRTPKAPRSSGQSFKRGEVVHNTPEALYLYDPDGGEVINGTPCKVLPRDYEVYEKGGKLITIRGGTNAR